MYGTALKVRDRFGLDLTRNEASPSLSASDAVAEALTVCGRLTKFEEVAALCTHADHRQFRADYAIYDYARANKINFDAAVEVLLQREKTAVAYSPDVSG